MTSCSRDDAGLRARLVAQAEKLFTQFGVRAVRIEDIAHQIGISKKTLYQLVESKEELIRLFLEEQFITRMRVARESSWPNDPLEQAFHIWNQLIQYQQRVNPILQRDIRRFYPDLWDFSQGMAQQFVTDIVGGNLELGVRQGLYRPDLALPATAWWWMKQSQYPFPNMEMAHLAKHQFIRGLLTPTGFRHYEDQPDWDKRSVDYPKES